MAQHRLINRHTLGERLQSPLFSFIEKYEYKSAEYKKIFQIFSSQKYKAIASPPDTAGMTSYLEPQDCTAFLGNLEMLLET